LFLPLPGRIEAAIRTAEGVVEEGEPPPERVPARRRKG
jgi:hypothetical protein